MKPPRSALVATLTLASSLFTYAGDARGESPFDGKWRQSGLREDFTVQRWQEGCGPPPRSSSTGGGESITVHAEGDVLAFVGGGRVYRSNQCYDQLPGLARESYSHAAGSRQWRTRCATPAGDPRKTVMQTLVVASSDTHIDVTETGRYEISHEGGLCVADVRRSRSFDLVAPAVAPSASAAPPPSAPPPTPPTPAPTPPEEPPPASCANPGPAARLEVRPSKKLLRSGETFAFRAKVVDEAGCALGAGKEGVVKWAAHVGADAKISVDPRGVVTVLEGAREGSYELEATAEGKTARVTVEVSTAANYDALLAKGGLNAAGETSTASVTSLAGASIGSREVAAEDGRKRRRAIFVTIIGLAVAALAVAYFVLRRRQKVAEELETDRITHHEDLIREITARQEVKDAEYRESLVAHEDSVRRAEKVRERIEVARASRVAMKAATVVVDEGEELSCPTCQRSLRGTTFCPHDGSKLVAKGTLELAEVLLCPTCKRGFPAGVRVCPEHGEELVPLASPARPAPIKAGPKGKICPSCGARFDGSASFCGSDGTSLVLLN